MRYAIVENGVVTNIAESDRPYGNNWIPDDGKAALGAIWNGKFESPPPVIQTRDDLKAIRKSKVDSITAQVTSGKVFDGDETSQTRMARAIIGLQIASETEIKWTLADNTNVVVTLDELKEAIVIAGRIQADLWPL